MIKDPTTRKVLNRGFVPVRYRTSDGNVHGWVESRGTKWLKFWSITDDRLLTLPLEEERFMRSVVELRKEGEAIAAENERKRQEREQA